MCVNCRCGKAEHAVVEDSDHGDHFVGKIFDRYHHYIIRLIQLTALPACLDCIIVCICISSWNRNTTAACEKVFRILMLKFESHLKPNGQPIRFKKLPKTVWSGRPPRAADFPVKRMLHATVHQSMLSYITVQRNILQCTVIYNSALWYITMHCNILQGTEIYYNAKYQNAV